MLHNSNYPTYSMPIGAGNNIIEKYIKDLEDGVETFETLKSIDGAGSKTFDKNQNIIKCENVNESCGYIWKQLNNEPIIGITCGIKSSHIPHYHIEDECYYVVSGKAKTLCNDEYVWLKKGQYLYIDGNTIHNTPLTEDEKFIILYWFPNSNINTNIIYHHGSTEYIDNLWKIFSNKLF